MNVFFIFLLFPFGSSLVLTMQQSGMVAQMFADPKKFVSTFNNADPQQIDTVIEILQGLIDAASTSKQKATDEHARAQIEAVTAAHALFNATNDDNKARGIQKDKQEAADKLQIATDKALEELNKQTKTLEEAELIAQAAEDALHAQQVIIGDQEKTLKLIEAILVRLLARENKADISVSDNFFGRSLLGVVGLNADAEVNPDTVDRINEIIAKIRKEGEDLLRELGLFKTDSADKVTKEKKAFDDANNKHKGLAEDLRTAGGEVDTAKQNSKKTASLLLLAQQDNDAKAVVLKEKKEALDNTSASSDHESNIIQDVINQLRKLKPANE